MAAAAGVVDDLRLGGAAVDDEGAGETGANIGQSQPDQVGVLAEILVVARGKGAGGRGALCQDDDEHRERRWNQRRHDWPVPVDRWQTEMWQTTRNGSEYMHLLVESERPTYDNGADRRDQSSRNFPRNLLEADDDHQTLSATVIS